MSESYLLTSTSKDKAIQELSKILDDNPNNYGVLSKLITFLRQAGQIDLSKKYIENAKKHAISLNDTGLAFCQGLFFKYKL